MPQSGGPHVFRNPCGDVMARQTMLSYTENVAKIANLKRKLLQNGKLWGNLTLYTSSMRWATGVGIVICFKDSGYIR